MITANRESSSGQIENRPVKRRILILENRGCDPLAYMLDYQTDALDPASTASDSPGAGGANRQFACSDVYTRDSSLSDDANNAVVCTQHAGKNVESKFRI